MDILQNLLDRGIESSNLNTEKTLKHLVKFGLNSKSEVYAVCKCGNERLIKLASILRVIKRTGSYQCNSCAVKNKWDDPSYAQRHKDGVSNSWTKSKRQKQSVISRDLWSDSKFREKQRTLSIELWDDKDKREEASKFAKNLWRNLEYRKRHEEVWADSKYKADNSERIKKVWQRSDYKEKFEKLWADSDFKKKLSKCAKLLWESEEYRQKVVIAQRRLWENQKYRERMANIRASHSGKDSILERVTQQLLNLLNVEYNKHYVIGPYEFDLFVQSYDLLIECQGEYWHSLDKAKKNDAVKSTYIDEYFPQLQLLYLYERDFLNPEIVKQKLAKAIYGENTEVTEIDFLFSDIQIQKLDMKKKLKDSFYSEPEEFLQSFHYAGFGRSAKVIYGAYLGDKLTAICKFAGVVRKEVATSMKLKPSEVLELDRFCIHPEYQKKNFASWFISRCSKLVFEEFSKLKYLVSFADTTYEHFGTIYKAANWQEFHRTRPSYHYMSDDGFIMHKKTLYGHARSMKKTEREYAKEFGYTRIYGKEKIKFIYPKLISASC